jgi:hypothetical protein
MASDAKIIRFTSKIEVLQDHIKKYQFGDGYLQLMVKFLSNSFNGTDIIFNSKISFWDRLGFVIRYCTDDVSIPLW